MAHRLHIQAIDEQPLAEIHYLNARPGGGIGVELLPILRGVVGELPGDLDAITVCSDLQGILGGRERHR